MAYSHAKEQGQTSVGSEARVDTNGQVMDGRTDRRTDGWKDGRSEAIALPNSLMRSKITIADHFESDISNDK